MYNNLNIKKTIHAVFCSDLQLRTAAVSAHVMGERRGEESSRGLPVCEVQIHHEHRRGQRGRRAGGCCAARCAAGGWRGRTDARDPATAFPL